MLNFFIVLAYGACLLPLMIASKKGVLQKAHFVVSGVLAAGLTLLLVSLRVYTEVLWFEELAQAPRYWTVFKTRLFLFVAGFVVSLAFFYIHKLILEAGFKA
ncbi:MAG: hypothetical protein V2A71_00950, partial [Candidatus Eisenbacteria bacterium]